jgi:ribonuclease J
MAKNLLSAVQKSLIDVLLMEGTQFSPGRERGMTEHELEAKIVSHLQDATGLALACFSPMHVDRLVTFYKAARKTDRVFVVDPYAAFVMHLAAGQCKIPPPTKEAGIQVYYNQYFRKSWERRRLQKIYAKFNNNRIELDEIMDDPSRYLMLFRPSMLQTDFSGKLPQGVCCLYSYWTGYLENSDWTKLRADVEAVNGKFIVAHTSGHIFREDIIEFVKAVNPRIVVPIHTFQPEEFSKHFSNAKLLQDGEEFVV